MNREEMRTSAHRSRVLPLHAAADRAKVKRPTRENPLIISASELRDFLTCRVKWAWRYGHKLERKTGGQALEFGILIHSILEGWYSKPLKKRTVKKMEKVADKILLATSPRELTTEDFELIKAMTVGYANWVIPQDQEIGVDKCSPEEWFELPLTDEGNILIRGKIDNIFVPKNLRKTIACMEFKSKKQIRIDMVETLVQLSVYLWALRKKYPGYKTYQAYYTVLRKQMPGPRVRADLFHREPVERTDEEIDQWAEDTARAALDMMDAAIYPNPSDACSWSCDFYMPCLLRGRKDDLEHVLSTQYQKKVYRP